MYVEEEELGNGFGQYCIIDLDENENTHAYYKNNQLTYKTCPKERILSSYRKKYSHVDEISNKNDHMVISLLVNFADNIKAVTYYVIGICTAGAILAMKK